MHLLQSGLKDVRFTGEDLGRHHLSTVRTLANKSIMANKSHGKKKEEEEEEEDIRTVIRDDNIYFSVSEIATIK